MTGGGGFRTGRGRRTVAGTLAAKVTTEGVKKLTREFNELWGALKNVRGELAQINNLARGAAGTGMTGGVGQGTPTGAAGTTIAPTGGGGLLGRIGGLVGLGGGGWGGQGSQVRGPGGFNFGGGTGLLIGSQVARTGFGMIEDRFQRNLAQSVPISAQDALTAAMYGTPYRGAEMRRFGAVGEYAGSREAVQAAQQIALGFGTTMAGSERFLRQAGAVAQASGGTLTAAGAAQQVGLFAAPMVARRAQVMGIPTIRQRGELQNPLQIGLEYVKDYEKRTGVQMNEIDFANLRSPGSPHRQRMKMVYGLSDEAIDVVIQAGMQNMQFRTRTGGRTINFGRPEDLRQIGLGNQVLGLQAARFGTTVQRREARFFEAQEGAMSDRLNQERAIQEVLADTEDAFGGLLGVMHEFQRVLQAVTTGLGLLGGLGMLTGGLGGGGGGGGGILQSILGAGGTAAPGAGVGRAGMMMGLARGGAGVAGAGLLFAGLQMGRNTRTPGGIAGAGLTSALGGAGLGFAIGGPIGAGIGAGAGLVAGTAYAAVNYFKGVDKRNVQQGFDEGVGMTDQALIDSINDYVKNAKVGLKGEGAGAKQRGRFDAFARRRGALLAAALDEAMNTGAFSDLPTQDTAELAELVAFFGSDAVFDDGKLWSNKSKADKFVAKIRGQDIWRKYFGTVTDPFAYTAVNTEESKGLIMSAEQTYQAALERSQTGDGAFARRGGVGRRSRTMGYRPRDPFPKGGDAVSDKAEAKGETWSRLDSRMKERLLALFRASGGRVWLGNGWRSEEQQRDMFLSRYVPHPEGEVEWNGQRWRHVSGAAAAPPGRSMHEIGMAADLEGDLDWVQGAAAGFQLKTFANVNNEPWHVQPVEFPNSRSDFEAGGGTTDGGAGGGTAGAPGAPAPATPQPFSGGGGGAISGINYSVAAAAAAVSAPSGILNPATGTAATAPGGAPGTPWTGTWPGDMDQRGMAVAKVAANVAGFHGDLLYRMIAIAKRESQWNPNAHNPVPPDDSYGLWQINMLGGMGPDRARALGIDTNRPYEELFDPNVNARAAKMIYDSQGAGAWSTNSGVNEADIVEARRLATAAGVGDAVFDPGMSIPTPRIGGNANVNINVAITSTGNVRYDAEALGEAVRPVLSNVMAEISTKRGS